MLGSNVMVAPIFTRDASSRQVFFPYIGERYQWVHFFTGEIVTVDSPEGLTMTVDAPLG